MSNSNKPVQICYSGIVPKDLQASSFVSTKNLCADSLSTSCLVAEEVEEVIPDVPPMPPVPPLPPAPFWIGAGQSGGETGNPGTYYIQPFGVSFATLPNAFQFFLPVSVFALRVIISAKSIDDVPNNPGMSQLVSLPTGTPYAGVVTGVNVVIPSSSVSAFRGGVMTHVLDAPIPPDEHFTISFTKAVLTQRIRYRFDFMLLVM